MNREEAARVLSNIRDTLKKVYLVAIDEERISTLESAIGFLLAKDNNVHTKQPDPITGLCPCGCGGKAILFHHPDFGGPGSDGERWAVFCEKTCGMETSDMTSQEYAVETWNTGMGYTAPPLPEMGK